MKKKTSNKLVFKKTNITELNDEQAKFIIGGGDDKTSVYTSEYCRIIKR